MLAIDSHPQHGIYFPAMPSLTDFLKSQPPLIVVLTIAIIALVSGYVVPGGRVTEAATQCTADKGQLVKERDQWQRIALRGSNILQQRARDLAEIAPSPSTPNQRVRSVTIQAKPLPKELRREVEKPPIANDAMSVEKRITASEKVLESAPVPTLAKPKGQPE